MRRHRGSGFISLWGYTVIYMDKVYNQIFKQYDDCQVCQAYVLTNANLAEISIHLHDSHFQKDVALYVCSRNQSFRFIFQELYDLTRPYHEPNFDRDLKLAFHSKAWEMIVARSLIKSDCKIKSNIHQKGPDYNTDSAYIECINATPSSSSKLKIQKNNELIMCEVPENEIQLRITNAFASKSKIIKKYIEDGVIDAGRSCVIAINYSGVDDYVWADSEGLSDNFVLRSLFAMGPQMMTFDPEHEGAREFRVSFKPQLLKNKSINVPANYFLSDSDKHISAVIYSSHQIESDRSEEIFIVNNPFAEFPVNMNDYTDMWRIVADLETSTLHRLEKDEVV